MDRMTKILDDELNLNVGQAKDSLPDKVETFVNYTITTSVYSKSFDFNSISIVKGNNPGIHGKGIIVNDQLIENCNKISDIIDNWIS